ncbi:MAG: DUF4440 domain-containing protein [Planctomycetota bacterium]
MNAALAVLSLVAVTLAGCSSAPLLRGTAADRVHDAIDRAWRDHIAAKQRRDIEGVVAIYTADAVYVVDGLPPVIGRAALEVMERRGLDAGEVLRAEHVTEALRVDGDLAWELGTITADIRPQDQDAQRIVFHYIAMWRLGAGRQWRIAHLVGQVEAVFDDEQG